MPKEAATERHGATGGEAEVACDAERDGVVGGRVVAVDAERERALRGGVRVEVEGRGEAPAARAEQEAVVAEVVVGVADRDGEDDAPPELRQVLGGRLAAAREEVRDVEVASLSAFSVGRAEHRHRGGEVDARGAVAVEAPREEGRAAARKALGPAFGGADAGRAGERGGDALPRADVGLVGLGGELGDPERAVGRENVRLGTRAAERGSGREEQREPALLVGGGGVLVGGEAAGGGFEAAEGRPGRGREERVVVEEGAVRRGLEAQRAEAGAVVDAEQEVGFAQAARGATLRGGAERLAAADEAPAPAVGTGVEEEAEVRPRGELAPGEEGEVGVDQGDVPAFAEARFVERERERLPPAHGLHGERAELPRAARAVPVGIDEQVSHGGAPFSSWGG